MTSRYCTGTCYGNNNGRVIEEEVREGIEMLPHRKMKKKKKIINLLALSLAHNNGPTKTVNDDFNFPIFFSVQKWMKVNQ